MAPAGAGGGRAPPPASWAAVAPAAVVLLWFLVVAATTQAAAWRLLPAPEAEIKNAQYAMMSHGPAAVVLTVDHRQSPGKGHFTSIQAAINAAPASGGALININPGTYREKVVVNKSGVSLVGTGPNAASTVVTWSGPWSNVSQYEFPLFVQGQATDFVASRITFQNTWGTSHQAVAARVDGDKAAFYDCRFLSYQDTLFDDSGRHYYHGCYIEGATDFIFGNGKAFFENCHLHSISDRQGAFTAQGREVSSDNTGFSFVRCDLTGKTGESILGRPWRPYARVVFALCNISNTVAPVGWNDWNNPQVHSTAYFGEYQCYGQGSRIDGRVAWAHSRLSAKEAEPFLTSNWVDGQHWLRPQP